MLPSTPVGNDSLFKHKTHVTCLRDIMWGWTRHYCISLPQIGCHCSQVDMRLNMMLIRRLVWLSLPQYHRAWWCRSVFMRERAITRQRQRYPRSPLLPPPPSLVWGAMNGWMGAIMVIAIILLLVIVVGQRQQIKRSGSILTNCHCEGITKSSSRAVAEHVLRVQWLTPSLL